MSVKLKFRPSAQPNKEGTLIYQIIMNRTAVRVRSKHHILNEEWNDPLGTIILPPYGSPRFAHVNQVMLDVEWEMKRLSDTSRHLTAHQADTTPADVAAEFLRNNTEEGVLHYLHNQQCKMKELGRIRGSEMLRSTLNRLTEFRGGVEFPFERFDPEMMEAFEAFLKQRDIMRNTIGFYMRTLRMVYNRAVEAGLTRDLRPFKKVYVGKDKTVKRSMSMNNIKKLKRMNLSNRPALDFARDMFLFSFFTRGMPFVDMAYLCKKDLHNGVIVYRRHKTGQLLTVEWLPQMQAILDKYPDNKSKYLLPIITNDRHARNQYLNRSQSVNRNLKKVANMAKLPIKLSLYFARHSWASIAHDKNVPLAVISEALGHDNEATTRIYLNSIESSVVDKVNRQIMKEL